MKQGTSLLTRCLALAMALVLLVSNANLGLALRAFAGETDMFDVSEGAIVAANYNLTPAEKELISSGLLDGGSQKFSKPVDGDNLISVDNENKTVTVKPYGDAVSGKTWTPVEVKLVYDGGEEVLTLNEGKATYNYDGAAFSVEAEYAVKTTVDTAVQAEMLRAAAYLKEGKAALDTIKNNTRVLSRYSRANEYMVQLAEGIPTGYITVQFQSQAAIDSAKALDQQIKENGNLYLYTMANSYTAPYTKYLVENGAALKAMAVETYTHIQNIMHDDIIVALQDENTPFAQALKAEDEQSYYNILDLFIIPYEQWLTDMAGVVSGTWPNGQTASFLKEGMTAEEYTELDSLVANLGTTTNVTPVAELTADTAKVQLNMSMSNVTVRVLWNAVDSNNELPNYKLAVADPITLPDGTAKADILAKIQEVGFEAETVAAWTAEFPEFSEHYVAGYDTVPETLSGDIEYNIIYMPRSYAVTGGALDNYYMYGYTLTLPKHPESPAKVYDYTVNGKYMAEGEQVVIKGDIEITRAEGSARSDTTVLENVLQDENLTADERKILTAEAVTAGTSVVSIRFPSESKVTLDANTGVVTAQTVLSDYPGKTLYWIPTTAQVVTDGAAKEYTLTEGAEGYTATITENNYDSVTVLYTLTVADQDAGALKNLPYALAADAKEQLASLADVATKMDTLDTARYDTLDMLMGYATGDTLAKLQTVLNTCYTKDGTKLDLYHNLVAYTEKTTEAEKLVYYYQNKATLDSQVDVLREALKAVLADEEFKDVCIQKLGATASEAFDSIAGVEGELDQIALPEVDPAIDVNHPALMTLAEMLVSNPNVNAHRSEALVMEYTVTKAAPGKVTITVNLTQGANKASFNMTVNAGQKLNAAAFNAKYDEAFAKLSIADAKYYTDNSDAVAAILDAVCEENKTYELTWTPQEYKVEVDGVYYGTITINNKSVILPAHETEGMAYIYTVNGVEKNQGDEVNVWDSFHDETLTITRVEFDQKAEEVKTKFEKFVAAVSGASSDAMKFTFNEEQTALTLEVDVAANEAALMEALTGFVEMLAFNQDYTEIALNTEDNVLYQNLTFSIQALMNTILSDANFNNAGLVDALENGQPLLTAKMLLDSEKTIDFYVKKTGTMAEIEDAVSAIEAITPYVKFQGNNGELDVQVTLPEKVYEVYLTALLGIGEVDLSNTNAVNTAIATMFVYNYMEDILGDELITTTTWQNTLEILDETAQDELPDYDLTQYEEDYQLMRTIFGYATVTEESGIPVIDLNVPAMDAIDTAMEQMGETIEKGLLERIVEYTEDGKLTTAINVTLANTNVDFEAVVADLEAIKTGASELDTEFTEEELNALVNGEGLANGVDYTSNLGKRLSEVKGEAVVLLLDDVNGDLTFNDTTVLDLNGKTINGNIVANGQLYIFDSYLGNAQGGVNGKIEGNVTITAGKYSQDVSAFLPDGYKYQDGLVVNELYTVVNDNGNLTYQVNTDVIDADIESYKTFAQALAAEMALDVVMNNYIYAMLEVDGYNIYEATYDDYIGLLAGANQAFSTFARRARANTPDDAVDVVLDSISLPALADYINDVIEDMLDFAAIEAALRGDGKFVQYTLKTAPWDLVIRRNAEYDCITGGLVADQDKTKTRTVTIQFVGDNMDVLADFFGFLDDIVVEAKLELVDVQDLTYADKHFNVVGGVDGTLILDLSDYTTHLAILVANALDADAKTAMVNAVNSGDEEALKAAFDAVTAKNIADALKLINAGDSFNTLAEKAGINATIDLTEKQQWLEAALMWALSEAGWALEELEVTGTGDTLGALDKDNDGTYDYSDAYSNSKTVTHEGYGVNFELTKASGYVAVILFETDDCLWGDANHDGEVNAKDATLIHQYRLGTLNEDQFFCTLRTDVTDDGAINAKDATLIHQYRVGTLEKFPAED